MSTQPHDADDLANEAADLLDAWASAIRRGDITGQSGIRSSIAAIKRGLDAIDRGSLDLAAFIGSQVDDGILYHEDEAFHGDGVLNGPKLLATAQQARECLTNAAHLSGQARDQLRAAGHAVFPIGQKS